MRKKARHSLRTCSIHGCGTVLNSANPGPYCLLHQETVHHNDNGIRSLIMNNSPAQQIERMTMKIRVEVARTFHTTVVDLEYSRSDDPAHLAVLLILIELFGASPDHLHAAVFKTAASRRATMCDSHRQDINRQVLAAKELSVSDDVFNVNYHAALDALRSIDPDILPDWARVSPLLTPRASGGDYKSFIVALARTESARKSSTTV